MRFAFHNGDWAQHISEIDEEFCEFVDGGNPNYMPTDADFQAGVRDYPMCANLMDRSRYTAYRLQFRKEIVALRPFQSDTGSLCYFSYIRDDGL